MISGVLTISYESTDPIYSRDVANRMVELLNEWFLSRGGTTKLKHKTLLEKKLVEVSTEISDLENQIQDFQRKYGVLTVEELAEAQSRVLADLIESGELPPMADEALDLMAHNITVLGHMWTFRRWFLARHYAIERYIDLQVNFILKMCRVGPSE